jgi:hypothetical protein
MLRNHMLLFWNAKTQCTFRVNAKHPACAGALAHEELV